MNNEMIEEKVRLYEKQNPSIKIEFVSRGVIPNGLPRISYIYRNTLENILKNYLKSSNMILLSTPPTPSGWMEDIHQYNPVVFNKFIISFKDIVDLLFSEEILFCSKYFNDSVYSIRYSLIQNHTQILNYFLSIFNNATNLSKTEYINIVSLYFNFQNYILTGTLTSALSYEYLELLKLTSTSLNISIFNASLIDTIKQQLVGKEPTINNYLFDKDRLEEILLTFWDSKNESKTEVTTL